MLFFKKSSLVNPRGFSLVEVLVAAGVTSLIALGTGKAIINTINEKKKLENRAENFAAVSMVRAWVDTRTKSNIAASNCGNELSVHGAANKPKATFAQKAAQYVDSQNPTDLGGVPIAIQLPGGTIFRDNVLIGGAGAQTRITKVRFVNAQVVHSIPSESTTYYNGQIYVAGEKVGDKSIGGYPAEYPPTLVGGITIAMDDGTGDVKSCAFLPKFDNNKFCDALEDMVLVNGQCVSNVPENAALPAAQCAANEKFAGFRHDSLSQPLCVAAERQACPDQSRALRGVRHGIDGGGADGVDISVPECAQTKQFEGEQTAPEPPKTNRPVRALGPAPVPVNVNNGPGRSGGNDCPSPAQLDQYEKCIALRNYALQQGATRTIICQAAPPANCYKPIAVTATPATTVAAPAAPAPPPAQCVCGATVINSGEYCGTYYFGNYGFNYARMEASAVLMCTNGELSLQSDTNPANPYVAPARITVADPESLPILKRSGNFMPVVKSGAQYAIP